LLSIEAKLVQPASPCFQCNHLQVPENLPEWLLFDLNGRQRQSTPPLTCAFGCAEANTSLADS